MQSIERARPSMQAFVMAGFLSLTLPLAAHDDEGGYQLLELDGAISDLIFAQDGGIVAVVVAFDGFLGIGEKNVALSWAVWNWHGMMMRMKRSFALQRMRTL